MSCEWKYMSRKLRLVVADDDATVRECLRQCLTAFGHDVLAVSAGLTLLDACATNPPDVIVSDVQMPDLDGITAAEVIRRDSTTPIVLLSGNWDPPGRDRAIGITAVWCLAKPVHPQELAHTVVAAADFAPTP